MPKKLKPIRSTKSRKIKNARSSKKDEVEEDDLDMIKVWNGGTWFYVNKSGFPMSDSAYEKMWSHAMMIHPAGSQLRDQLKPVNVPMPKVPYYTNPESPVSHHLELLQKYLIQLEYNYTGTQFFDIRKDRPYSGLMDSARTMVKHCLPIKCLEAVIISLYLTNECKTLDRFPISFDSSFDESQQLYRHVVLGVYIGGKFGALGLSRKDDLMHRNLQYTTLAQLIVSFLEAYKNNGHKVRRVKIGLCAPHDPTTYEPLVWSAYSSSLEEDQEQWIKDLERFSRQLKTRSIYWKFSQDVQHLPTPPKNGCPKKKRTSSSSVTVSKSSRKQSMVTKTRKSHPVTPTSIAAC